MKNIFLTIVLLFCLILFTLVVFAQATDTLTHVLETQEDYQLAYPGLLPDNPLYTIKVIRDRIIEFLIADPLKASEFYLLASDKRLSAGISLLKKQSSKEQLAYSTISKTENYFEKTIQKAKEAKTQGKDITNHARNLKRSLQKHTMIVFSFIEEGPKNLIEQFKISSARMKKFGDQINALAPNQ